MKKFIFSISAFIACTLLPAAVSAGEVSAASASGNATGAENVFGSTLEIMGKGMAGIFVVMLLIYLAIVLLNKFTKDKE